MPADEPVAVPGAERDEDQRGRRRRARRRRRAAPRTRSGTSSAREQGNEAERHRDRPGSGRTRSARPTDARARGTRVRRLHRTGASRPRRTGCRRTRRRSPASRRRAPGGRGRSGRRCRRAAFAGGSSGCRRPALPCRAGSTPRNLRPSATAWLRIATMPDRDREHHEADERDAPRSPRAQQHDDQRCREQLARATRRTRPPTIIPTPPATPAAHAHCRSRLVRAPRARTSNASASARTRRAPRNRDPRGATACATRQACGRGCRPPRRIAGRRPRSRRSSRRSAPPPRGGGRARPRTITSTAGASSMYSSHFARRDGVRARRVRREVDSAPGDAPEHEQRERAERDPDGS